MGKPRVLVVEESDVNRELVEDLLGVAGCAVVALPFGRGRHRLAGHGPAAGTAKPARHRVLGARNEA